ncbi:Tripartite tricarboxylate transporter TctB family protein [compost metagenome]
MLNIRNPQDFLSGILFVFFGSIGFFLGLGYDPGTLSRMGPGMLPVVISAAVTILGIILVLRGLRVDGERIGTANFRSLCSIPIALVIFSLLIRQAGLPLTVCAVMLWLAVTGGERRWIESVVLALAMTVFCVAVFVYGLGQPVPLWIK